MTRQGFTLVLIGWLAGAVLFAQQPMDAPRQIVPPQNSAATTHNDEPLSPKNDKRFAHITKRYKLTAQQQSQVHAILQQEQQDAQLVNADPLMSRKDKGAEVASLFEASQQKIGTMLTKEQKRKFDADEKRRAWTGGRLPNPNPGPF